MRLKNYLWDEKKQQCINQIRINENKGGWIETLWFTARQGDLSLSKTRC